MSDERCPTCGCPVNVWSGDDGTCSYEPAFDMEALVHERDHAECQFIRCLNALRGCIPWVASNKRGQAQEALAIACQIVGYDPYDWSSEPEVLARRIELLEEEGE